MYQIVWPILNQMYNGVQSQICVRVLHFSHGMDPLICLFVALERCTISVLMNQSMTKWTLKHTWTCGEPNFFSGATLAADLLQLGLKRRPILPREEDPPFLVVTAVLSPLVSSQISAFFLPRLDLSPRELLLEPKRPQTLVE